MQIFKNILIIITTSLFFNYLTTTVNAAGQYGCPTQYGGECPGEIALIKKYVQDPVTKSYEDTLESNGNKFSPEDPVFFKIRVTNTGNETLNNIKIEDQFPDLISFVSGAGKFDNNTKKLSFEIDKLQTGETKEYIVKGKIVASNMLPANESLICVLNKASIIINGQISSDTAQLCIEKPVLGTKTKGGLNIFPPPQTVTTPQTGAETFALLSLLPAAVIGTLLKYKSD
ncbi:MAG: hypothetical protein KatS3mg089_0930 [Patescibacteria group bacterium]|nr:MAG: hypothetical protein KatS3mg089_0930 [Patescibacteria group bacterium]